MINTTPLSCKHTPLDNVLHKVFSTNKMTALNPFLYPKIGHLEALFLLMAQQPFRKS